MTRRAERRGAKTARAPAAQATPARQRPSASKANLAALERAFELHRAGRLSEAEPLYRAVIQREPSRTIALLNFSILLRSMGRLEEALALAGRAIAIDPKDAMAHFTLGATVRLMRRDRQASAAYEKALAIDPFMIRAWVNLAVASERLDRKRSVAALDKALAGEPDNLVALNMKLKYALQECNFEGSAKIGAKIVDLAVKHVDEIRDWRILANIVYRALFVTIARPLQRVLTDRIDAL